MPYQGKMQQQAPEEHKKARPEEQFVPEQRTFGMPNSLMQAVPMAQPGTPNSVMREMEPEERSALFRGRGFDPTVGAHELSHTVRREPAHGPVRQTVPSGTIQRSSSEDDIVLDLGHVAPSILDAISDAASDSDSDDDFEDVRTAPPSSWFERWKAGRAQSHEARKDEKEKDRQRKEEERARKAREDREKLEQKRAEEFDRKQRKNAQKNAVMSPKDQQKAFNRGSGADVADSSQIDVGGIGGGLEEASTVRGKETWREWLARKIDETFYKEE